MLSSSSSSFFSRLYAHALLQLTFLLWDLPLHDDDLCGGLYGDPLLESVGMDLGEHLQEGLLDIHLEPWDKDELLELHKASPPEVHLVPWQDSYQLGIGQLGTLRMVEEVGGSLLLELKGCSLEGRQGLVDQLEVEDLDLATSLWFFEPSQKS